MTTDSQIDDNLAKRNLVVLVTAQIILGSQLPMILIVGGLAGQLLAPHPCLATLGISAIYLGSMTTAPWLSAVMSRFGRRVGLMIGALGGALGATIAGISLLIGSFPLFVLGSFITGIYQSSQGFLRFTATDTASEAFRPKAISYVLAAGIAAAIIGPQLVKVTYVAVDLIYFGTYMGAVAINLIGIWVFLLLRLPPPRDVGNFDDAPARNRRQLLQSPDVLVAIICAMVSYALMTLMMTSTPLAIVGCGFTEVNAADVVSAHVVAMFAPSFVTGHLIARFGSKPIVAVGLAILVAASITALLGVELWNFFGALVLLGVGWNFGFIGATNMLATTHTRAERGRVQGLNDMMVFGCVTLASLASGGLMNCSGADAVAGWSAVSLAMLPFIALAAVSLIWLGLRDRRLAQ